MLEVLSIGSAKLPMIIYLLMFKQEIMIPSADPVSEQFWDKRAMNY